MRALIWLGKRLVGTPPETWMRCAEIAGGGRARILMGIKRPTIGRNGSGARSLIGQEAREAMTRRVHSERYGKPIDHTSASQVFAGILQRLAQ